MTGHDPRLDEGRAALIAQIEAGVSKKLLRVENDRLRVEIARLNAENDRLRDRIEHTPRPTILHGVPVFVAEWLALRAPR